MATATTQAVISNWKPPPEHKKSIKEIRGEVLLEKRKKKQKELARMQAKAVTGPPAIQKMQLSSNKPASNRVSRSKTSSGQGEDDESGSYTSGSASSSYYSDDDSEDQPSSEASEVEDEEEISTNDDSTLLKWSQGLSAEALGT